MSYRPLELCSQEMLDAREAAIERVQEVDYNNDVDEELKRIKMSMPPHVLPPASLAGKIEVAAPGSSGDEGDVSGSVAVVLSESLLRLHGDRLAPLVDPSRMYRFASNPDDLMAFYSYVVAYLSYAHGQLSYWVTYASTMEARRRMLQAELSLLYQGSLDPRGKPYSITQAGKVADLDPSVRELDRQVGKAKGLVHYLQEYVRGLSSVEKLCSRHVTMLMEQTRSGAWGGNPASGYASEAHRVRDDVGHGGDSARARLEERKRSGYKGGGR